MTTIISYECDWCGKKLNNEEVFGFIIAIQSHNINEEVEKDLCSDCLKNALYPLQKNHGGFTRRVFDKLEEEQ